MIFVAEIYKYMENELAECFSSVTYFYYLHKNLKLSNILTFLQRQKT